MAGSNAGFDAAAFRQAIKFAMHMGLPEDSNERATFRWSPATTYDKQDPTNKPYSWDSVPVTNVTHPDVQVDVAVEFGARSSLSSGNSLGQFDNSRVEITVLDDDYDLIRGADQVLLGGNVYIIQFVAPPIGLFDVTVYTIYAEARDES